MKPDAAPDAAAPARSGSRRGWLLGAGVGAAALAAGAGWRLWSAGPVPSAAAPAAGGGDVPELWTLRFPTPAGGELDMATLRGKRLLLNFWATWCAPCVREMPELDRFARTFGPAGWNVVGLAIDGPTPVREFLAKTPVGYPIGLAGLEGTELSRRLGNERGGLPFTVAFDAAGRIVQRKLGEASRADLEGWARGG